MEQKDQEAVIKLVAKLEIELRAEFIKLEKRIKELEEKWKN